MNRTIQVSVSADDKQYQLTLTVPRELMAFLGWEAGDHIQPLKTDDGNILLRNDHLQIRKLSRDLRTDQRIIDLNHKSVVEPETRETRRLPEFGKRRPAGW